MPRKKEPKDKIETYWFKIDGWTREYRFGINHHPWELSPGRFEERDSILLFGNLRNNTRRKFSRGELHLLPSTIPREQWSDDTDRIGNAWIENGKLCYSAWIASDSFHSLPSMIASKRFLEMIFTVRGLRYNRGATDFIELNYTLSELYDKNKTNGQLMITCHHKVAKTANLWLRTYVEKN